MPEFKSPADMQPGDRIDLESLDLQPTNTDWEFEFAEVEAVSMTGNLAGGWLDQSVTDNLAVIYTVNGSLPSMVRADLLVPFDGNSECF